MSAFRAMLPAPDVRSDEHERRMRWWTRNDRADAAGRSWVMFLTGYRSPFTGAVIPHLVDRVIQPTTDLSRIVSNTPHPFVLVRVR